MTDKELIHWCMQCGTISQTEYKEEICRFCEGKLKEIGWVEQ
jgi:Zn finger protein HypA/HybF involved in hydrogenase expression